MPSGARSKKMTSAQHAPELVTSSVPGPWDFYRTEKELRKSRRRAEEWILPTMRHLVSRGGARILDVGCGNGVEVAVLRANGFRCVGIDFDPNCHSTAKGAFAQADACRLPFANDIFDSVLSLEVIEHIGAPPGWWRPTSEAYAERWKYVSELLRVTKPGGVIVLATPNRHFPFDEHGTGSTQLRWHLPVRDLTLSYFELKKMFCGKCAEVGVLPYGRYYELEKIQRLLGSACTRAISSFLHVFSSRFLHVSPVNPHLFLYFRKFAGHEQI
jgi:SAM-dependent methyltransferase